MLCCVANAARPPAVYKILDRYKILDSDVGFMGNKVVHRKAGPKCPSTLGEALLQFGEPPCASVMGSAESPFGQEHYPFGLLT